MSSTYMTAEEAAQITATEQSKLDPIWKIFLIGGLLGVFSLYWVVKNLRDGRIGTGLAYLATGAVCTIVWAFVAWPMITDSVSVPDLERSIRSDLQAQAVDLPGVSNPSVSSVDCVKSSDQHARCLADVDYNDAESGAQRNEQLAVNVTIGRDGQYVWEVAR